MTNKIKLIIFLFALAVAVSIGFIVYQNKVEAPVNGLANEEESSNNNLVGGDKDEHGCIGSADYLWCEEKQKCLRIWEENCESIKPENDSDKLSEAEAREIAEKTCVKGGETISGGYYNENTKSWWFDANLNSTKEDCSPACVVFEETQTAEISWRCTGLIIPKQ